jgi:hypothetical protein
MREYVGMKKLKLKSLVLFILIVSATERVAGQNGGAAPVCRQEVFAELRPLPKLSYACRPDAANDYDERILKWPERIRAIKDYTRRLATFSGRDWWETGVDELNYCYFRGAAGEFSDEEKERFRLGDYQINLFGNDRIRLVLVSDPCYQTSYNGANAFLLYRQNGRVFVTEVLDGHFSRADNSVGLNFASLHTGQLIEISTGTGGLNPYITNYYFVIDKRSGKAVPKRIFKVGKRLTHRITSAMLLDDGDLPRGYTEMEIIKGNRLADTFNTYEVGDGTGVINAASGLGLLRRVYKWNGRYYSRIR